MTRPVAHTILVIGYGNPARGDDGIGPAVAEEIEHMRIDGVDVDADYQLTVEDAATVAKHDFAVFVDASLEGDEPFTFSRITPRRRISINSHAVSPEDVLGLAHNLFHAKTEGYLLGIRGYSFTMFKEKMTPQAKNNKRKAVEFLVPMLRSHSIHRTDVSVNDLLKPNEGKNERREIRHTLHR